jgi:hypothetical protein
MRLSEPVGAFSRISATVSSRGSRSSGVAVFAALQPAATLRDVGRHLLQKPRRRFFEVRHPDDQCGAFFFRKSIENGPRLLGIEVREHEGLDLRVFRHQNLGEIVRAKSAQRAERVGDLRLFLHLGETAAGFIGTVGFVQHLDEGLLEVRDGAASRREKRSEVFEGSVDRLFVEIHVLEIEHRLRDGGLLVRFELLEQTRGHVGADERHQDRDLVDTGERVSVDMGSLSSSKLRRASCGEGDRRPGRRDRVHA